MRICAQILSEEMALSAVRCNLKIDMPLLPGTAETTREIRPRSNGSGDVLLK